MKISEMINKTSVAQILWSSDGSTLAPESQSLWSSLTGQIEEAMRPWGWLAAIRPDERERVKQQWEDAVLGPRVFTLQCQLRNTEKGDSMLALLCAPLFNNAGTLDGWVSWMSREREPAFLATTAIPPEMLLSDEIASQAPLGMVCLSLDRSFIRANERYCQIVGYAQEELLGRRLQAILPVDIQMLINLNTRQMLRGDMQHVVYETAYPRPDGQRLWLKVISTLVWHPQGFPLYFFSWVEDLTLQRRGVQERRTLVARQQAAQVAAQRAKEQAFSLGALLQVIFQNATEGVIVYDRDGRMQQINNAARTLLELGPEDECLGKTVMDLFSGYERYNEAMEPIALEALPVSRLLQGQAVSPARIPALHVRFPSGQERYLDLTWTPLHDQAGQAAGLVTIFRDVTSRYQQEQRIQHAFQMLSFSMEAMVHLPLQADQHTSEEAFVAVSLPAVGQHLTDVLYQVLDCSMACLTTVEGETAQMHLVGISGLSQELAARVQYDTEHSTLFDYLDAASIARLRANQVVVRDLVEQPFVQRPTYGMHNFLMAPMLLEGQLVGAFGIDRPGEQEYTHEDIELVKGLTNMAALVLERVRLLHAWAQTHANELALQEANRRFDTFLSLASHELRTPLTGIRGSVQLTLRRLEKLVRDERTPQLPDEMMQRLRHPLEEAIERATVQDRMISDLLDVSRIQADRLEMRMNPVNLVEIVQRAVADVQYLAPERSIVVHWPAEQRILIIADADRIGQVVSNYLSNALKYSARERLVELWLTQGEKMARVSVKDQGPGLTPQEQQVVWERFYQVKGIQVEYGAGAGLGLGLYLCRTIIERHGGQVGVHSVKGEGSTFWFTLPLAPEQS